MNMDGRLQENDNHTVKKSIFDGSEKAIRDRDKSYERIMEKLKEIRGKYKDK